MVGPMYVSPEQWMQDKAEFARKGIARGRSIVAMEYASGIVLMAENASASLNKLGELYDRIGFAGVGKFSEFEQMRKAGVRYCDVTGFAYSRDDVRARALANSFSQSIGDVFTRKPKPFEVEILVAEVGDNRFSDRLENSIYRVQFDGAITDEKGFCSIGGDHEDMQKYLKQEYRDGLSYKEVLKLGRKALEHIPDGEARSIPIENLEVGVLDRTREGRKFRRLTTDELQEALNS